jgi:hypothetical protein
MEPNEDFGGYALTPEAAAMLAENPQRFRLDLRAQLGGEADALFLLVRFAEAREKGEGAPPTEEECEVVGRHYAEVLAFSTLFELVLKGVAKIDVVTDEDTGELTTAFGLTADGREIVEGNR